MSQFYKLKSKGIYLLIFMIVVPSAGCFTRPGVENVPVLTFTSSPGINQTNVPINTPIQLFFNALLDPVSIVPSNYILTDSSGNIVPSQVSYTPSPASGTSVLTLTPLSFSQTPPVYLNVNSVYTVVIGSGIKQMGGGAITALSTWSFITNNSTDVIPPTFAGPISAQAIDMGSIKLTWGPAVDNPGGTPSNKLIYSICYSISPLFCSPTFVPVVINPQATVDSNGNFNFVIKSLQPDTLYYFMVRVSDLAGNQDSNTVMISATTKSGTLYVANFNSNNILGFDQPSKLTSSLSQQMRSIKASQNGLIDPYGIFYDQVNDRLYISTCISNSTLDLIESVLATNCQPGSSTIAVYNNASTLPGMDQKPDWTIVNNPLSTNALNGPTGLFLDNSSSGNDTLYVANFEGGSVTIYPDIYNSCQSYIAQNLPCAVTPGISNFTSGDFQTPFGIAYDAKRHLLYVSNYVNTFQSTDSAGDVTQAVPGSTIAVFDETQFRFIPEKQQFSAIKNIGGTGSLASPAGLWYDAPSDTLYIANSGPILGAPGNQIYAGIVAICNVSQIPIPSVAGTVQPLPYQNTCTPTNPATQFLAGSNTGLTWPIGVAVTTPLTSSTPSLYVSDYANNNISVFSPNPIFSGSTIYNNTYPNEQLLGLNKEIQKPAGITAYDSSSGTDNLFVVNLAWDQILLFDRVAQYINSGPCVGTLPQCTFAPARSISPSILGPAGIYLNNTPDLYGNLRDRLYVTNFFNNTIAVLDGASTLTGNAFSAITKIVSSSALQNPFGIYVDTSQSREWVYVVNSRPDNSGPYAGLYAIVVFDLSQCPTQTGIYCDMDSNPSGLRVIHSSDFSSPSGVWVDEGVDVNNQPRDLLFVSNRGTSNYVSPGYITLFTSSSTLSGSVASTKIIKGYQTSLYIPTGLFMDPTLDQLYVANQGYDNILVFNQPQNCTITDQPNICDIIPDRNIYNTSDLNNIMDGPSSLVIDFSSNQLFLANLGLYSGNSSIVVIGQASSVNGQATISNSLTATAVSFNFPLNLPESIALDVTR